MDSATAEDQRQLRRSRFGSLPPEGQKSTPEKVGIYRGMTKIELKSGEFGISWTLDKEKAEFFAYTYVRNTSTNLLPKTVHKIIVDKKDIIAYFNGRKEQEIIYIPDLEKERMEVRSKTITSI